MALELQTVDEVDTTDNFIVAHSDADGISAAALYLIANNIDIEKVRFPEVFGDYVTPNDIMLDMTPLEGFKGLCIDHHPQHPENPEYQLIWDNVPTTYIVWKHFKENIPKGHWWKVVVGVAGDGQANVLEPMFWYMFPELLLVSESRYWGGSSYKNWEYPVYLRLASLINAAARSRNPNLALRKLIEARTVDDILEDAELEAYRVQLSKRVSEIVNKEAKVYSLGPLRLVLYSAEERLGGRIAHRFWEEGMTVIAVNQQTNEVSIRGDLTTLLVELLNKGYGRFGGHAGYAGGELTNPIGPSTLYELITKIFGGRYE